MAEEKYLYGAAVQGIQGFIFQTNKLRDIVGASELVEEICTTKFASLVSGKELDYKDAKKYLKSDENAILFAAGNVKYIFETKEACEKVARVFPKEISEFAPGITVSQAVVKMEGKFEKFEDAVNELEKRLRTQRNKPMQSQTLGLMGILRSRQSGLPVVKITKGKSGEEHWDAAKLAKLKRAEYSGADTKVEDRESTQELCKKAFGLKSISNGNIAHDIEDLTKNNDWIAVIHADGNGLGQIVQKVGKIEKDFKEFSQLLDEATTLAAVKAYEAVKGDFNNSDSEKDFIPIRPIVLGGDDLTVVCRADLALKYTETFIDEFEKQTKEKLEKIITKNNVFEKGDIKDCLTACAGIAYVKSSYPFYYAYELAETLCTTAKKDAKAGLDGELPKSCLMFHKVQDSFTEDWNAIVKRELMPQENISFEFGPYYINEAKKERWTLEELMRKAVALESKEGNAVKSHLRNWMSLLHDNPAMAEQKLKRLKSMTSDDKLNELIKEVTRDVEREYKKDGETKKKTVYPVYDILAVHTINNQKTK